MSNDMNFSGSFQRFLKGDVDPGNIFGLNPSRSEMRDNAADRGRRADQIAFEQTNEMLRDSGGSTDAATKQVAKLRHRTGNRAFSPLTPLPLPSVTITEGAKQLHKQEKGAKKDERRLAAKNEEHERTALLAKNLKGKPTITTRERRLTEGRLTRSILGATRV
jgi:hypothetical protein